MSKTLKSEYIVLDDMDVAVIAEGVNGISSSSSSSS